MEVLGNVLAPYSYDIAMFAGTVTCLQFLSGVFMLNDIRRKGSSDTYPPVPFIGGLVLTILCVKHGSLMGDSAMMKVNITGFVINVVFTLIFYWYASKEFKKSMLLKGGIAGILTAACLAYSNFEDAEKIEFRFGILITTFLVLLVAFPLLNLGKIIRNKSTEGLPFPLILSGTIVAASWLLYGISVKNTMLTYQNLFLFLLSATQLMLFAVYPNTPAEIINARSSSSLYLVYNLEPRASTASKGNKYE